MATKEIFKDLLTGKATTEIVLVWSHEELKSLSQIESSETDPNKGSILLWTFSYRPVQLLFISILQSVPQYLKSFGNYFPQKLQADLQK